MHDLNPRQPYRPFAWPSIVFDLHDLFARSVDAPVYIVGGAVRDALLGWTLKDIDLATDGDSLKLARKIANATGGDFFVLDSERRVGRALIAMSDGHISIDVAHFRGDNLLSDLTDRDFTINALAVNLTNDLSRLIDPLGGERDIQEKIIRRCHARSIANDPIRSLRALRQSLQFGMRIEPQTLADIRADGPKLVETSPERIRDEFIKLLSGTKPDSALRLAKQLALLELILPEIKNLPGMADHTGDKTLSIINRLTHILTAISPARSDHTGASFGLGMMIIQLDRFRPQLHEHIATLWPNERSHQALLILAVLLHGLGVIDTSAIAERTSQLRLSKNEIQRLTVIIQNYGRPLQEDLHPISIHRFWRHLGKAGVDVCLVSLADYLGNVGTAIDQDYWLTYIDRVRILLEAFYDRHDQLVAPPPLLDGNDLINALNLSPSPIIGKLLDIIREGQVAGEILTSEDALVVAQKHLKDTQINS